MHDFPFHLLTPLKLFFRLKIARMPVISAITLIATAVHNKIVLSPLLLVSPAVFSAPATTSPCEPVADLEDSLTIFVVACGVSESSAPTHSTMEPSS